MFILIVDDDPLLRRLLINIVEDAGHKTCWAATGDGALKLMRNEPIELVILDMNLGPNSISGWDVAREKLLDPSIRQIPVIIVSGSSADDIHSGALATQNAMNGVMLILGKPVSNRTLVNAVRLVGEGKQVTFQMLEELAKKDD